MNEIKKMSNDIAKKKLEAIFNIKEFIKLQLNPKKAFCNITLFNIPYI